MVMHALWRRPRHRPQLGSRPTALEGLPLLAHAFAQGRLSFDKLSALLAIATSDNEAELLEQALALNLNALKSLVRRQRPVTKEEEAEAHEQRSLRWAVDERKNSSGCGAIFGPIRGQRW